MSNPLHQFRQDLVSGHWVLFSTDRGKRPNGSQKAQDPFFQPKESCPFENPQLSSGEPLLVYHKGQHIQWEGAFQGEWTTQVIKNKYPALREGVCGPIYSQGPFAIADGNGFHEVVITRDHDRSFAHFSRQETEEVIHVYKDRFDAIARHECGDYIQIIHNHGPAAGASIYHNHSQIFSTPILPPDVMGSIRGSMRYFQKHGKKVHDVLLSWELEQEKRIVYQNDLFVVFCPFVSRVPYEMRIFPKIANPSFQHMLRSDVPALAQALNHALQRLDKALGNPDYNFFVHTAPISKDALVEYDFYHWHIEIWPRISKIAGFELGTHIYINTVDPDEAAETLRRVEVSDNL